jgi:hypothetical protein
VLPVIAFNSAVIAVAVDPDPAKAFIAAVGLLDDPDVEFANIDAVSAPLDPLSPCAKKAASAPPAPLVALTTFMLRDVAEVAAEIIKFSSATLMIL